MSRNVLLQFKELLDSKNKHFVLKDDFKQDEIDKAIDITIEDALREKNKRDQIKNIKKDMVVIHGMSITHNPT